MASIQHRTASDGTVSYRVQIRLSGFPPQRATFARKADATRWARQTEAAIREGRKLVTHKAHKHTLADLVERHLDTLQGKAPHAYPKQRQLLYWWKERLGARSLARLTPAIIADQRDALLAENIGSPRSRKHRATATANRYLAALSKACSVAVKEWHWLRENPVRRVYRVRDSAARMHYLSVKEKNALLAACGKSPMPELELVVMLAITTGMRRGEILALRWPDIDLARGSIVIHGAKNREPRAVPIMSSVLALLGKHSQVRHLQTDLVFPRVGEDRAIDFDHALIDAAREAKIKKFRFHDLRHTAASYLALSGATTAEISAVLGHKTLAVAKRYVHLCEQHTGAVIDGMANKFFG